MIELIPHGTNYDFIGKWRWTVLGSLAVIALGLAAIPVLGLRWGIDFAGGAEVQVHFEDGVDASVNAVRAAVRDLGLGEPTVVRSEVGGQDQYLIRYLGTREQAEGETQNQAADRIQAALVEKVGAVTVDRVEFVGPKVGAELRSAGTKAMAIAWLMILVYIGFRFSPRFAPGAVVALIHDVVVTSAIWILLGQPFDLQVLAGLLAIVGYSINDTIIIYDRIRETMALRTSHDLADVINRSVNATLSRTILTGGLTLVAVLALLLAGGPAIFPFSATMAIGIVVGTYSSIYIAAPIMLILERRFGETAGTAGKSAAKGAGKKRGGKRPKAARA
ncbi:MAG: protein translocase subunit SecF [Myxococcota bacterium]|nr:protein translocase subunit SecF [Myxococcota bacterium]